MALLIIHGNRVSGFQTPLRKKSSFAIHEKNIQSLALKLYKIKSDIASERGYTAVGCNQ